MPERAASPHSPSRQRRRQAAHDARRAAERAEAVAALRRRRVTFLAVTTLVVAAAIAGLLLRGGNDTEPAPRTGPPAGVAEVTSMLAGLPQDGVALGDADAPVTLVEFADLQCPFCRDFAQQVLPLIVRDHVRTGKVRIEFQPLAFIGPDSRRAADLAAAAAAQDRLWEFTDLFYFNQGSENSGYATDAFLERLLSGIDGLDARRARSDAGSPAAARLLASARALAERHGVESTPSLLIGRTGDAERRPVGDPMDYEAVRSAIDRLSKG